MTDIDSEIILECSRNKDGIRHTDLVEKLIDKTGYSPRFIKNSIKELTGGSITKQIIKGHTRPLYFINSSDFADSHRLYMLGTKQESFFSQKDVSDIITFNEDNFELEIKDKEDGLYSNSADTLVIALYWHQKLTFAIYSGYFGTSKSELELAKNNSKRIEKLISKIYNNAKKIDPELWHNLLHAVHDVIELNRKLTKEQVRKIWST